MHYENHHDPKQEKKSIKFKNRSAHINDTHQDEISYFCHHCDL